MSQWLLTLCGNSLIGIRSKWSFFVDKMCYKICNNSKILQFYVVWNYFHRLTEIPIELPDHAMTMSKKSKLKTFLAPIFLYSFYHFIWSQTVISTTISNENVIMYRLVEAKVEGVQSCNNSRPSDIKVPHTFVSAGGAAIIWGTRLYYRLPCRSPSIHVGEERQCRVNAFPKDKE